MKYTIGIHDYQLNLRIGCHPKERDRVQPVFMTLSLNVESNAHDTDNIEDAPDYYFLSERIRDVTEANEYALLERLAVEIGGILLGEPRVISALVTLNKPEALPNAKSASVSMHFER